VCERPGPHDRGDADEENVGRDRGLRVRNPNDQITGGVGGADLDQSHLAAADIELELPGERAGWQHQTYVAELEGPQRLARVGSEHGNVAAPWVGERR
jgi:hypothetical protein